MRPLKQQNIRHGMFDLVPKSGVVIYTKGFYMKILKNTLKENDFLGSLPLVFAKRFIYKMYF